ncbi:MAG: hypothetical protein KGY39_06210 [Anaerolineales bacterium]|nr:hypothetical protein [Anaerolineales bacterium]MBS3752032.1 hypothetical protein [Anaerolineales bacterium]
MKKKRKLLGKVFLGVLLLLVAFVLFLEIGSRRYMKKHVPQRSFDFVVCDQSKYPVDEDKIQVLKGLVGARREGQAITQEDLNRAMIVVREEDMTHINGVYCNGLIYVSEALPEKAMYYVARHELEHVFQHRGVARECDNDEFCANWIAGSEYPLGLLQTIFSSLIRAYHLYPSVWVFLYGSWRIFRYYFLGLG